MKVSDVAKEMGVSPQAVRVQAVQKQLPFITVSTHPNRNTYIVNENRYRLWKEGKL